jgi:hypothetical protein
MSLMMRSSRFVKMMSRAIVSSVSGFIMVTKNGAGVASGQSAALILGLWQVLACFFKLYHQ